MIALDTNVVSELARAAPDTNVVRWVESHGSELTTTAITVAEAFQGVALLPRGKRRQRLQDATERLFGTLDGAALAFDEGAARIYAQMHAQRARSGKPLPVEDGMIAAICVRAGAALATRNTDDYRDLGVTLIDPWMS